MDIDLKLWRDVHDRIRADDISGFLAILNHSPFLSRASLYEEALISFVSRWGKLDFLKELLERGADLDHRSGIDGSPIQTAAAHGHIEVVRFLLSRGACLDVSRMEHNPLFDAVSSEQPEIVRLLAMHVDPKIVYTTPEDDLRSVLDYAIEVGNDEIVQFLEEQGCRPNNSLVASHNADVHSSIADTVMREFGSKITRSFDELVPTTPDIKVHAISATEKFPFHTIFTTGASVVEIKNSDGSNCNIEMLMHLPRSIPFDDKILWPVQWIRNLAYLAIRGELTLYDHVIVESSEPLALETSQTCWLLIKNFSNWDYVPTHGRKIDWITVMSIFTEERDFEIANGTIALLELFQKRGIQMVTDPKRQNVALC